MAHILRGESEIADQTAPSMSGHDAVVAALTYDRPEGLSRLLAGLAALTTPARCLFLIIDNNPAGDARAIVEAARAHYGLNVRYLHEAQPGISAGRNRALIAAAECGAHWLGFIDDDEVPAPNWLARLFAVQAATGAAAVVGAVEARLPQEAPAWLKRGGFFSLQGREEGQEALDAATNNVLIDLSWIRRFNLRFDAAFGLSGGEDTLFFRRLRQCGGKIVFAPSALVTEFVAPDRARLAWLRRRWRRGGNAEARIAMLLGQKRRWQVVAGGLARVFAGAVAAVVLAPCCLFGRADTAARGLQVLSYGEGRLLAAAGVTLHGYKRSPG